MSLTKDIWKLFDSQKKNENKNVIDNISLCTVCNNMLKITEDGFYCCSNNPTRRHVLCTRPTPARTTEARSDPLSCP